MMVRFLSVAEVEFTEAAAYYEDKDGRLGDTFIEHVVQSVRYLERHPLIGHLIDKRVRKVSLRRFPYNNYLLSRSR